MMLFPCPLALGFARKSCWLRGWGVPSKLLLARASVERAIPDVSIGPKSNVARLALMLLSFPASIDAIASMRGKATQLRCNEH